MFRRITTGFLKIPKKARTAFIVSLFMPGAGHIYNREVVRGVVLWSIAMGFFIWGLVWWRQYDAVYRMMVEQTGLPDIARAQALATVPLWWLPLLFYVIAVAFSAFDAYLVARQVVDLIARERTIRESERRDVLRELGGGDGTM